MLCSGFDIRDHYGITRKWQKTKRKASGEQRNGIRTKRYNKDKCASTSNLNRIFYVFEYFIQLFFCLLFTKSNEQDKRDIRCNNIII